MIGKHGMFWTMRVWQIGAILAHRAYLEALARTTFSERDLDLVTNEKWHQRWYRSYA